MSAETVMTRIWLLLVGLTHQCRIGRRWRLVRDRPDRTGRLASNMLVIRHFMELDGRFPRLHRLMNGYIVLVPALLFVLGSVFAG
ncbi:MAG: hypothetical protein R3E34_03715 [Rhodocyclaceae bacterium]